MTSAKQVQQHINQLINDDVNNNQQLQNYYDNSLTIIKNSLNAFFVQYATDTGLDINTVTQQASQWDIDQFNSAINVLLESAPSVDTRLTAQLQMAQIQARQTKRDTLAAIIGASVAVATAKSKQYSNDAIDQAYADEYNYTKQSLGAKLHPEEAPQYTKEQHSQINAKSSVHGDLSKRRITDALDTALKHGLDKDKLSMLLNDKSPSGLSQQGQAGASFNQALLRANNINANNNASQHAMSDDGVDYVKWMTEDDDKVCDICAPLDEQIYPMAEAPIPQQDTHINCRCQLVACDASGNLK